jgi:hypothetical protein
MLRRLENGKYFLSEQLKKPFDCWYSAIEGVAPFVPDLSHLGARRAACSPCFVDLWLRGRGSGFAGMKVLVTGSSGLIGSEAVEHF